MTTVFRLELNTNDFFDNVIDHNSNEDTREWEDFVEATARAAARTVGPHGDTRLMDFMEEAGYTSAIGNILYKAMRAFTNRRIICNGEDFDLC